MKLLENELIRKYFGPESGIETAGTVALRILTAMQEPIRKGERYLSIGKWGKDIHFSEAIADDEYPQGNSYQFGYFHPTDLRLPQRFQPEKKECEPYCPSCEHCHKIGLAEMFDKPPAPAAKECHPAHGACVTCKKCLVCDLCRCPKPDQAVEKLAAEIAEGITGWAIRGDMASQVANAEWLKNKLINLSRRSAR